MGIVVILNGCSILVQCSLSNLEKLSTGFKISKTYNTAVLQYSPAIDPKQEFVCRLSDF